MTAPISRRSALLAGAASLAPFTSWAQGAYPNRPIQLIHGFGAGGNADVVARLVGQKLQESLKQIGVDLQIDQRPSSEFNNVYTSKDFDVFMMGFSSSDPFGVAYFGQIYASDSGLNLSGTGTPEFDKKIEEMTKIGDPEEQIKAANELEVEAFKLYGIMPMFNGPSMTAVKDGLANIGSMGFAVQPKQNIGWVDAK